MLMILNHFFLVNFGLLIIYQVRFIKKSKLLQQKKTMTQNYSNLCQNINRYTLSQLNHSCQIKYKSLFQNRMINNNKTTNLIKVVSPFYQKSKCIRKGPCFCAYHRQKKAHQLNSNSEKKNKITKQLFFPFKNLKNVYRFKTQSAQKANISNDVLKLFNQKLKKQVNFSIDNYENISHKVLCRNSEFQQFLKKNQLYILTGKLPIKLKEDNDQLLDEEFLQSVFKSIQSYYNEHGINYQSSTLLTNNQSPNSFYKDSRHKKSQKLIQKTPQRFNTIQVLKRLKKVIQSLINGRKKMTLQKMKKIRDAFAGLINKQIQNNNETSQVAQLRKCLVIFDDFLVQCLDQQQKQRYDGILGNLVHKQRKISRKNTIIRNNQSQNNKAKKNLKIISKQNLNSNKQQIQNKTKKQNERIFNKSQNNFQQATINQFQQHPNKQNQNLGGQIEQEKQNKPNCEFLYKNLKKVLNSKYSKKSNLHNKTVYGLINHKSQQLDKKQKEQNKQQINLRVEYLNNSRYFPVQNKIQQRVERIKQIRDNKVKVQQILDKNYLRMKRCIQKNRKFIKKMETKFHDLQLDLFIIEPTDSLITKKKKIRCLRQILENNNFDKQRRNGFYDQIIRYLDIYTEHCNMVMKKDMKKKKNQLQDLCFQGLQFQQLSKEKDFTNSLKFIDLHQNDQGQRQKKLQGWISIPQYITNGEFRSKFQKIQQSLNKNKIILMQKPQTYSQQSEDSLIQIELNDKFQLKNYISDQIQSRKYFENTKQKSKKGIKQIFNEKINQLKKKFGISNYFQN